MLRMFKTYNPAGEVIEKPATAPMIPVHTLNSDPIVRLPSDPMTSAEMQEYIALSAETGFVPPNLAVEAFKTFLIEKDIPVFALAAVVKYMDKKAAEESKDQAGWMWRPLREKDQRSMQFGHEAARARDQYNMQSGVIITAASDLYNGPAIVRGIMYSQQNGQQYQEYTHQSAYDKTVPIHALKKVALIEREFKGDVAFFVNDYAPAPHIQHPDPFLMAVVPNPLVDNGTGRFVIDFWDEPGFGLAQMLK